MTLKIVFMKQRRRKRKRPVITIKNSNIADTHLMNYSYKNRVSVNY